MNVLSEASENTLLGLDLNFTSALHSTPVRGHDGPHL
jgi:hypothetical protein